MGVEVEIRYAGVTIGLASEVRPTEQSSELFVALGQPMPVGSVIGLGNDTDRVRVEKVVESADPSLAGMLVRRLDPEPVSVEARHAVPTQEPPAAPGAPAEPRKRRKKKTM
jgi:hypothetical protein